MKILHIWDVAGVSSLIAKHQSMMGHETKVVMLKKNDPAKVAAFYGKPLNMKVRKFIPFVICIAWKFDVIHIHNISHFVPVIKMLYPNKKVVIHYHGFTSAANRFAKTANRFADNVFVASTHLHDIFPDAIYIPTPVDIEHFTYGKTGKGKLAFTMRYLDLEKFKSATNDDEIQIIDREITPIDYKDMPEFLKKYETYYDMKFVHGVLGKSNSKTCLEALACGLKVVNYNGDILTEFPKEHLPENSAKLCLKYYGLEEK